MSDHAEGFEVPLTCRKGMSHQSTGEPQSCPLPLSSQGDRSVIWQDVNSQTAFLRGKRGGCSGAVKGKGVCLVLSFELQGTLGWFLLKVSLFGEESFILS